MSDYIDCAGWINIGNNGLLHTLTRDNKLWYLPGGKVDKDESHEAALIREIREELSVDLIEVSIKKYGIYEAQADNKPRGVKVVAVCFTADFKGEMKPTAEVREIKYIPYKKRSSTAELSNVVYEDLRKNGLL